MFQHGLVVFPHDQLSVFVETDSDVIRGHATAIPMTPSNSSAKKVRLCASF